MFLVVSFLLNSGLLVFIDFGGYFETITKELNTSDAYYLIGMNQFNRKIDQYILNNPNIKKSEKLEVIYTPAAITYNGSKLEMAVVMQDMNKNHTLSKWKYIGKHLDGDTMAVYVPYVLNVDGGYKLNDRLDINIGDKTISFVIKGFIEDGYFSTLDFGALGIYMSNETMGRVEEILGDKYKASLVYANLNQINISHEAEIRELLVNDNVAGGSILSADLPLVKQARTMMASMTAFMMVAFSVVITIVSLIVIRFQINNDIEDDMGKIGSLKAMGYTGKQIILSIILYFLQISVLGGLIGIAISYFSIPIYSPIFESQSGIKWVQGFDGLISSMVLLGILLAVIVVSFVSALPINKLHPILALRGGIVTHNFKKNYFPLDTSTARPLVTLALKSIFQNLKQSLMLLIILIGVTFANTFAVVMYYNSTIDTGAFSEVPGFELANISATVSQNEDSRLMLETLGGLTGVGKAQYLDNTMVRINDIDVVTLVMDDYSKKETNNIYEGRYPIHGNEISISGTLSERLNKGIGDTLLVNSGDKNGEYLVTGLTQGMNLGLLKVFVTTGGILRLNPGFKQEDMQIYLNKGIDTGRFAEELKKLHKDSLEAVLDIDKNMEQHMGVYSSIISKVGLAILLITILVVVFVLHLVINSIIIRRKRELGIQKSMGFTTFQLMNQVSLSLMIPVSIGVFIGSIIGMTQVNRLMSTVQKPMGIMKTNFIVNTFWITCFSLVLLIVSYMTSIFVTYRIRKISAYELVTE